LIFSFYDDVSFQWTKGDLVGHNTASFVVMGVWSYRLWTGPGGFELLACLEMFPLVVVCLAEKQLLGVVLLICCSSYNYVRLFTRATVRRR